MKTLGDHPMLIGQLLRRAEERERRAFMRRNVWWRRMTLRDWVSVTCGLWLAFFGTVVLWVVFVMLFLKD